MAVVTVVGAQWGDEGKGSVVDVFLPQVQLLVHYAGGGNPGQTIAVDGERLVFHLIPTSPLRQGKTCLLAQGMAIDPGMLLEELATLERVSARKGELLLDQRAHVILPHHRLVDEVRDEQEGASGMPRRGIGPCYADKLGRRGVQMGDLLVEKILRQKVTESLDASAPILRELGGEAPNPGPIVEQYLAFGDKLRAMTIDGGKRIADEIKWGGDVLLEGPLGTMVDLEQGSYPFVVAASTTAGGACTGTGIAPAAIDQVLGIAKAYTTRAGAGPFPAELTNELAITLQKAGGEIGPITGRPRRCGMFDVPALRYAARVNGFTQMALTKLDVLSELDEIPMCVGYELDGELVDEPPYSGQSRIKPKVEMFPGWKESISEVRSWDDLPDGAKKYVGEIEERCGVEVTIVGVGPDTAETIVRKNPFG